MWRQKKKKKRELKESAVETKEICRKRWRSPFRTAKPNLHVENQQLEISIMSLKRYDVTRLAAGHARGVSCHNLIDSERLLKKNLACRLEIMLDRRSYCQNNTRAWIVPVITVTCQVGPEDSIDWKWPTRQILTTEQQWQPEKEGRLWKQVWFNTQVIVAERHMSTARTYDIHVNVRHVNYHMMNRIVAWKVI